MTDYKANFELSSYSFSCFFPSISMVISYFLSFSCFPSLYVFYAYRSSYPMFMSFLFLNFPFFSFILSFLSCLSFPLLPSIFCPLYHQLLHSFSVPLYHKLNISLIQAAFGITIDCTVICSVIIHSCPLLRVRISSETTK
jgi:hypothetical protein